MFIAEMSTIAKMWKEAWCPSKDEWIKMMWFMYTMEYYSAIKNDKYPPFASTWMKLEGITLSEPKFLVKVFHAYGLREFEMEPTPSITKHSVHYPTS